MEQQSYINRLTQRYNRPLFSQRSKAAETIALIDDPNVAWRKLSDSTILPDDFQRDQRHRRFAFHDECEKIWPTSRPDEKSHPSSIMSVLTIGADPQGMVNAEKHARELARRLKPWNAECNSQVVWYFTDNPFEVSYLGQPYDSAVDSVSITFWKNGIDSISFEPDKTECPLPTLVRRALGAWEGWNEAVRRKYEFAEPGWIDHSKWEYFSDLENPFEPLLELWCTGYRFVSSFEEDDPVIRLYVKPATIGEAVKS